MLFKENLNSLQALIFKELLLVCFSLIFTVSFKIVFGNKSQVKGLVVLGVLSVREKNITSTLHSKPELPWKKYGGIYTGSTYISLQFVCCTSSLYKPLRLKSDCDPVFNFGTFIQLLINVILVQLNNIKPHLF